MWSLLRRAATLRGAAALGQRTAATGGDGPRLPVLTLFTRHPCVLCNEAKEVLKPFLHRVELEEVDIMHSAHSYWFQRYRHDIPVVHLDGRFVMEHRVHPGELERRLSAIEQYRRDKAAAAGKEAAGKEAAGKGAAGKGAAGGGGKGAAGAPSQNVA
ncbi:glutaredoxin-like protein C5orf63 homolog [Lethenteron reissneri]|uniref:glutaredoxin-like protein C5orf63 homolog n=1 Tax=Lethenteron reissneri TaxID=7753 RepID=UPI002AB6B519|nr:glutaredoxin-like protein C5orf63 homolog [Lethenteron reissneri]